MSKVYAPEVVYKLEWKYPGGEWYTESPRTKKFFSRMTRITEILNQHKERLITFESLKTNGIPESYKRSVSGESWNIRCQYNPESLKITDMLDRVEMVFFGSIRREYRVTKITMGIVSEEVIDSN